MIREKYICIFLHVLCIVTLIQMKQHTVSLPHYHHSSAKLEIIPCSLLIKGRKMKAEGFYFHPAFISLEVWVHFCASEFIRLISMGTSMVYAACEQQCHCRLYTGSPEQLSNQQTSVHILNH